MADLSTQYMGLSLKTPVVVGACSLSKHIDTVKEIEEAGAGALVIKSLFQEQIELEAAELESALSIGADSFAESLRFFPPLQHAGPAEHLMWVKEARKAVEIPLIASVNATSTGAWVDFAEQLEDAGVDGLELNVYSVEANPDRTAAQIEADLVDVVEKVKAAVSIPVAVKLSPYYTSMANVAKSVAGAGADGLTLFNRFFQPDIDPHAESLKISLDHSTPEESRAPLRWLAILSDQISCDLAASTGVYGGLDVARYLLAGASVAQVVSALYANGVGHITQILSELDAWMESKGYASLDDFRGNVSRKSVPDPSAFERAQYIKLLVGQE